MKDGQFYDPVAKEVEDIFMPWVGESVTAELEKVALSQQLAAHVLEAAVKRGQEQTEKGSSNGDELRAAEAAAMAKRQAEIDAQAATSTEDAEEAEEGEGEE